MKSKLLLIVMAVSATLILLVLATTAFPGGDVSAQEDSGAIRIEVSRFGFNKTEGEFRLEVEAGQEVVITFVYGDSDLPQNNPHIIYISGYDIQTDILDRENPEVTVRFTADRPGEINFMCILLCNGHENLQRGRIIILPSTGPPIEGEGGPLFLTAPEQAQPGQPLTLTAILRDKEGQPIVNVPVKFFIRADFFASGLMEIGEALTNSQGVATLEYTPRQTGEMQVVARYQDADLKDVESTTTVRLAEKAEPFYQAEAGLRSSIPIPEVFIGPQSALEPGERAAAPITGFRIPGGLSFWLMAYVFTVITVWSLYLRVMYLVFRIPVAGEITDTNTRLVPLIIMILMVGFVTMLVLILLTGPYSHPNLLR